MQWGNDLQQQRVVVVGGSSGIGFAVAQQAASQGAKVVIVSSNADRVQKAVECISGEASSPPAWWHSRAQVLLKSCGATDGRPQHFAFTFTIAQITFGVKPWPQILPALLIDRSNGPAVMPAPTIQLSTAAFTHCGTGIVRMWPPFPLRSAMTQ